MQDTELIKKLVAFTKSSLANCTSESEKATIKINDILSMMVENQQRVSALSDETKKAVGTMRQIIDTLVTGSNRSEANRLASTLKKISFENEADKFVSPIIEALQFQDRMTQNMHNFTRMLEVWSEFRSSVATKEALSDEDLSTFGKKLLDCTTMEDEKAHVRKHISNLPEAKKAVESVLFF